MRYFIATYYRKPNGKYSEQAKADSKIRNKDLPLATVILDYKERKIVKCNLDASLDQRDFDKLNDFYKQHYLNIIAQLEAKYQVLDAVEETVKEMLANEGTATVEEEADDAVES